MGNGICNCTKETESQTNSFKEVEYKKNHLIGNLDHQKTTSRHQMLAEPSKEFSNHTTKAFQPHSKFYVSGETKHEEDEIILEGAWEASLKSSVDGQIIRISDSGLPTTRPFGGRRYGERREAATFGNNNNNSDNNGYSYNIDYDGY